MNEYINCHFLEDGEWIMSWKFNNNIPRVGETIIGNEKVYDILNILWKDNTTVIFGIKLLI